MSSGRFVLDGEESPKKDACFRFLLVLILLAVISVAVLLGCYAFKSTKESPRGEQRQYFNQRRCNKQPELDPYGLSNWTSGSEVVAFGCFPGHQIEGHGDVVLSQCIDQTWVPPPPACAVLPILLKCRYNRNGVEGRISMWQVAKDTPTFVHGVLNVAKVDKGQGFIRESIELSRNACDFPGEVPPNAIPDPIPSVEDQIEVRFNSTKLLGYKKAQLRLTLVFIDPTKNLRMTVVSIHQGQETLVMNLPVVESRKSSMQDEFNGRESQNDEVVPSDTLQSNIGTTENVDKTFREIGLQIENGQSSDSTSSQESTSP